MTSKFNIAQILNVFDAQNPVSTRIISISDEKCAIEKWLNISKITKRSLTGDPVKNK